MIELAKEKRKNREKDKLELPAAIPLMPIVEVNHLIPILYTSKVMVHIYTTNKTVHHLLLVT